MPFKKPVAIFVLLMICAAAFAQSSSKVSGNLIAEDGTPAAFVNLELKSLHKIVLSDENGNFMFNDLPDLNDSIIIFSANFQRNAIFINVCCGNKTQIATIVLKYSTAFLQDIEIKGTRTSSYKNDYSFFATKTQGNLKDVPQTISVTSNRLMNDRMDYTLNDVIENIAGVNLFSDYQEYTIRGFRAENPRLINGLRTYNATLVPPMLANIDRVEVMKGPSSVLYSNSDPGGLINMVTKKPLSENKKEISLGIGSWNDIRLALDFTGPFNKNKYLLYRLNAAYRDAKSFRDRLFDKSFQLAPSFSYIPNDKLSLNLDFSFTHTNSIADRGQPGFRNNSLSSTPKNLIVSQPGDFLYETDITSIITFSYKLNDHFSLNSSFLNYITQQKLSEHGIKNYITNDSAYLYYTNRETQGITNNLTNYAVWNFKTGSLKHRFLAGYDLIINNAHIEQWNGELPNEFGEGSGIVGTFDLIHPEFFKRPVYNYTHTNAAVEGGDDDDAAKYFTHGFYIQEQLSVSKWEFLFSLRQEFYRTGEEDDNAGNLDSLDDLKQNVLSPRLGITYKINDDVNVYATWDKGFEPFEASTNLPSFGGPFKPIYGSLVEAGVKTDLFKKRLYAAVSIYKIKQTNVLVNANDPSNPDRSAQAGADVSKGFEIEANGNILPNLEVAASYAYNITKIVSGNNPSEVGKVEANAPKNISGSWLKYRFNEGPLKNLAIAVGHSQVSRRNTYSQLLLPGYWIYNAGISYSFKSFSFKCNFDNITNKLYYSGGYNNINKWPGEPFNIDASIAYKFH